MAITKIHAINRSTKAAIKYIIDPLKTRNGELVEGIHCDVPTASFEFEMLADMSHRYNGNYERVGGRDVDGIRRHQSAKSYHLIQSFSPDDHVTPEEAHAIGIQLMRELLGNDYQFVIATHVDKDHIHNHIVFNAYSMTTLKKFRSQPYITANRIKEISNRLTAEHGLSVSLRRDEQLEKNGFVHEKDVHQSFRAELRRRLRFVASRATSPEMFDQLCEQLEITTTKRGQDRGYRLPDQQRNIRDKSLSDIGSYTSEGIKTTTAENADNQLRLMALIDDVYGMCDSLDDLTFMLQQEHDVTLKRQRNGSYQFTFHDGTKVPAELLPPAYQLNYMNEHWHDPNALKAKVAAPDILAEYQEQTKSKMTNTETLMDLSEDQVLSVDEKGALVQLEVPNEGQLTVHLNRYELRGDSDHLQVALQANYYYTLTDQSGKRPRAVSIRGEALIHAIDLDQGLNPELVKVPPQAVFGHSDKGLTITLPDAGYERVFIPNDAVNYDRLHQQYTVQIGNHWHYNATPFATLNDPEPKSVSLTGAALKPALKSTQPVLGRWLIANRQRQYMQAQQADVKRLSTTLGELRANHITDRQSLGRQVTTVKAQLHDVQQKIEMLHDKITTYNDLAKFIFTRNQYQPIIDKLEDVSPNEQHRLTRKYQHEINMYQTAVLHLQNQDFNPLLTNEEMASVITDQEKTLRSLEQSLKQQTIMVNKWEDIADLMDDLQGEPPQEEQEQQHHHDIER
ncbi:relaxase/mobilization nuclease domain-containing protein [Lacticaseibacillus paracasei]|uniref:relaxase/mobilization nuclease domain-containing protein n=1 Tax=Lacticaseibacillus paracasei TaxID=1597 RepID=UPI00030A933A|nr:relaxase/mobilization nuclease domain-containing protein [Lacticaseibacillus paracasei]